MAQDTSGQKYQMGTAFSRSTDGSSYTALTNLAGVENLPVGDADGSDSTTLASTRETNDSAYFNKLVTTKISTYLSEAQIATLQSDQVAGTNQYWKVTFVTSGSESVAPIGTFRGWVGTVTIGKAEKKSTDKIMCEFTIIAQTDMTITGGS